MVMSDEHFAKLVLQKIRETEQFKECMKETFDWKPTEKQAVYSWFWETDAKDTWLKIPEIVYLVKKRLLKDFADHIDETMEQGGRYGYDCASIINDELQVLETQIQRLVKEEPKNTDNIRLIDATGSLHTEITDSVVLSSGNVEHQSDSKKRGSGGIQLWRMEE